MNENGQRHFVAEGSLRVSSHVLHAELPQFACWFARMSPAEKRATQLEWKREWERIQAEQRVKQEHGVNLSGAAQRGSQQSSA